MVGTICSAVRGTNERSRRYIDAALLLMGSVIAGLSVGAAMGFLGGLLMSQLESEGLLAGMVVVIALVAFIRETRLVNVPLPMLRRQVPAIWFGRYDTRLAALGWGLQLGSAFATRLNSSGSYVMLAVVLSLGQPAVGMAIFGVFALVRGLGPIMALTAFADRPADFVPRVVRFQQYAGIACGAAAVLIALVSFGSLAELQGWGLGLPSRV